MMPSRRLFVAAIAASSLLIAGIVLIIRWSSTPSAASGPVFIEVLEPDAFGNSLRSNVVPAQSASLRAWLDDVAQVDPPQRDQFRRIVTETFTSITAGSWEGLEAILLSCRLVPDADVAEAVRERLRATPREFRPANVESMSHAELVAHRSAARGEGLRHFDPASLCLMFTPANTNRESATFVGESGIVRTVMEQGCAGRCVQAEMPYTSEHIRILESMNAVDRAHLGVRGVSASGQPVVLVISFANIPDLGWVPRSVYAAATGEGTAFFTPRI